MHHFASKKITPRKSETVPKIPLLRMTRGKKPCHARMPGREPGPEARMSLLIKNGRIVTAVDDYKADVFIENDVITTIGTNLNTPADTVIDASNRLVIPGGIDPHTHLDMPFGGTSSADDFESGTLAAAHGGTTTIVDFAIQNFGEGLYPAFEGWMKRAEGKASIDYAFHMIVRELSDQAAHAMDKMTRH